MCKQPGIFVCTHNVATVISNDSETPCLNLHVTDFAGVTRFLVSTRNDITCVYKVFPTGPFSKALNCLYLCLSYSHTLFVPMKKLCFILLAFIVTAQAFAQAKHTVTKSAVTYQIKNMGIGTNGKFKTMQASIAFDKDNLAASNIEATVEVNSIDSDNAMRDNHLKAEDYFDADKYPKISMKSTAFKKKAGNNYVGIFNVTIKGKTKPVEVPFTYTESTNVALFKGSFKINRKDFGVGGNSMVLADDATIELVVETSK